MIEEEDDVYLYENDMVDGSLHVCVVAQSKEGTINDTVFFTLW